MSGGIIYNNRKITYPLYTLILYTCTSRSFSVMAGQQYIINNIKHYSCISDVCLGQNCTEVHFKAGVTSVVIKFAISNSPETSMESNHLPDNGPLVELKYSLNSETKEVVQSLPFERDAHVIFSLLQGEDG